MSVRRDGLDLSVISSSAILGVRYTVSVSTAPASVSRDGTAATAPWRAVARAVGVMESVVRREETGPAPVMMVGEERHARGGSPQDPCPIRAVR